MNKKTDYKKTGVDIHVADEWVDRLKKIQLTDCTQVAGSFFSAPKDKLVSGIGDYASVFALSETQYLATSCDGVGTKLLWTIAGLGSAEDLAQDLVAMNSNDLLCVGARPLLFLDYLAVGSKSLLKEGGVLESFVRGLNKSCLQTGQLLVGGETAQMPDLYAASHFDLAGFNVGVMDAKEWLSVKNTKIGDEVWAWASSGPHSNGFTLLRKLFDTQNDADFIRRHLMKPTRLYVNELLAFREELKSKSQLPALRAAFHITGSGLLNFLRYPEYEDPFGFEIFLDKATWPEWLIETQRRSSLDDREMSETFNMGVGMALILDSTFANHSAADLQSHGLRKIGRVSERPGLHLSV
jgi:phosphoribosylformylglycinamidine cyclo-ligase